MNRSLLRYRLLVFREVIAAGGITAAARRLNVSQPAVSAQMKELETELGVALVDRAKPRFLLTEAGKTFAAYVEKLCATEGEALRALDQIRDGRGGRLAIGASETPGHYLLIPVFARFRRLFPDVALEIRIANSPSVAEQVQAGTLDLGFVEGEFSGPGVERRRLADDRLIFVVGRTHAWAKKRRVKIADLEKTEFAMRNPGSAVRMRVDEALREAGLVPRIALELGSTEAVKRAVAAGLGASFVPEASLENELAMGTLFAPRVSGLDVRRRLWTLRLASPRASRVAEAFLKLLPS